MSNGNGDHEHCCCDCGPTTVVSIPHIGTVAFEVVLSNVKAARALGYAHGVLEDLAEDLSWRPEVKKALAAMRYARRHLRAVSEIEVEEDS